MLKNYIKISLRNLQKYKGYSFINIFGLAIGIALSLMILTYVMHELNFDQFHRNGDRIVKITLEDEDGRQAVVPSAVAPILSSRFPEVDKWVRIYEPTRFSPVVVNANNNQFQEDSFFYADSSFFEIFSFDFISGSPQSALIQPRTMVLTEKIANKLFGRHDVVGEVVEARVFNRVINFEVTGVIKDIPTNSHLQFDYIASLHTRAGWSELSDNTLQSSGFYTYLLLEDEESKNGLEAKLPELISQIAPEGFEFSLPLIPLKDVYLNSNLSGDIGPIGSLNNIYGFSILAILVLLIAVVNYINLATARSSRRATEVGIRKSLGANRSQLVKQFYSESILLSIISVCIAMVLVEFFKEFFFAILGKSIAINIFTDTSIWGLMAGITVFTALVAGSYPAILLSSYQPIQVLKGLFKSTGSGNYLRKGLVVFQFTVSIFLILGTTIVYQQTDFMLTKDLGFDKEQIVILPVGDSELSTRHDILKQEALRQNGVLSASYLSNVPGRQFGGYTTEHAPTGAQVSSSAGAADYDVVETLGLTLLAGDGFPTNPNYSVDQGYVYLINRTLASAHGWSPEEAIDKQFNALGNRPGKVVGVIEDFNFASVSKEIGPLALFVQPRMNRHLLIKLDGASIPSSLSGLEALWNSLAPHRPFEFNFLDDSLDRLYADQVKTRNIFFVFAVLAILIASLGLFGLSAFMIEQRTKEIGIRKVLGASLTNIVNLLSLDFLKLVVLGFAIAVPIGWYFMTQWLQEFAYRIDISLWIFISTGVTAILIALFTVSYQSIKTGLSNPIDSLKSE